MRPNVHCIIAILIVSSFFAPLAIAQPAISNPSFEIPALPPNDIILNPAGTGWTFSSGTTGITRENTQYSSRSPILDGVQTAFFGGDTSASQIVGGFTIGQNYHLDWLQNRRRIGSGGVAYQAVLDKGLATEQIIAPYEVAGTPNWTSRSSDVFTATKSSYTVTLEALDLRQDGYANRYGDLDAVSFQATSAAVTKRLSAAAGLTVSDSSFKLELILNGVVLPAALTGQFGGILQTHFDYQPGHGIRNFAFDPSLLQSLADTDTTLDFGPLGTLDVTLVGAAFNPYTATDGVREQRLTAYSDGTFDLNSLFLTFQGLATYTSHGPIADFFASGSTDLATYDPADLGYTSNNMGDEFFLGPGNYSLTPSTSPDFSTLAVDIPIEAITQINGLAGLELRLSGNIHASGFVSLVPEPSGLLLAAIGCAVAIGCGLRRKRLAVRPIIACLVMLVVSASCVPLAMAQPSITNPSFETPALTAGDLVFNPLGTGWNFSSGTTGITTDGTDYGSYSPVVDGSQAAFFAGDTSATQVVSGFTPGQNYYLDWLQDRRIQGSGGLAFRAVLDKGMATQQIIAPYEVAGAAAWTSRASDVFTATKSSYTVSIEALDLRQLGYANRYSDLDALTFHTTSQAPTQRLKRSAALNVSDSSFQIELIVGGVALSPALSGQFAGTLFTQFDYEPGVGIRNFAFSPSLLPSLSDIDTTLDFGPLGTLDVTLTDAAFVPYTATNGPIQQRLSADPSGSFALQSLFMNFQGHATFAGTGPLADLLPVSELDLSDILAADLGYTSNLSGDVIFPGPGQFSLTPAPVQDQDVLTMDVPINIFATLDSSLGLEIHVTGNIHASSIVTLVPEPSTLASAAVAGCVLLGTCLRSRRRSRRR